MCLCVSTIYFIESAPRSEKNRTPFPKICRRADRVKWAWHPKSTFVWCDGAQADDVSVSRMHNFRVEPIYHCILVNEKQELSDEIKTCWQSREISSDKYLAVPCNRDALLEVNACDSRTTCVRHLGWYGQLARCTAVCVIHTCAHAKNRQKHSLIAPPAR